MSKKSQHNNILLAVIGFTAVVILVGVIGFFTLEQKDDTIQGEVEVSEYRVSCKLPGRVVELRVKEGDYVHVGDTLAILEVPEMKSNGAREQEKRMAANNTQASKSAVDVVKNLLKETVQVAQCEGEVSNVYPKVGELVGLGSPIMSISIMSDMWGTFNVREDHLQGLNKGDEFTAFVPAFNKEIKMKVYYLKDQGSYATWKATKDNGDYDRKTFEVKARPITKLDGLRPGMSLIIK